MVDWIPLESFRSWGEVNNSSGGNTTFWLPQVVAHDSGQLAVLGQVPSRLVVKYIFEHACKAVCPYNCADNLQLSCFLGHQNCRCLPGNCLVAVVRMV